MYRMISSSIILLILKKISEFPQKISKMVQNRLLSPMNLYRLIVHTFYIYLQKLLYFNSNLTKFDYTWLYVNQ